ncbi:MAG: hypothetical protein U1E91_02150 [Moraxella sp.]
MMFAVLAGAALAAQGVDCFCCSLLYSMCYSNMRMIVTANRSLQNILLAFIEKKNLMDIKLEQQQKQIEEQMKKENTSWMTRIKISSKTARCHSNDYKRVPLPYNS